MVLKYAQEEREDEVYYILTSQHHFNTTKIIYDVIVISVPIIKVYDCEEDTQDHAIYESFGNIRKASTKYIPTDNENTV
ncbi:MAG: hypothetical protein IPQ04_02620 [Saprospiraceae bacterium]|nr:hypothetical protein [Saprospiraceae bacterium]